MLLIDDGEANRTGFTIHLYQECLKSDQWVQSMVLEGCQTINVFQAFWVGDNN